MDATNHQLRLAARPVGLPKDSDWEFTEEQVADPQEGEIVVANKYISLDPAMRGWMTDARSYIAPVKLGDVMRAGGSGRGDRIQVRRHRGRRPRQRHAGRAGVRDCRRQVRDQGRRGVAPLPVWLNTLGMPGMTSYFGLLDIGRPQEGQTVVVSGAAGAVGSLVGQIAKIKGARAIGIAGGPEKCQHVVENLGFDAAIDYKSERSAGRSISTAPMGSTSTSTTSAARFSTPRWRS